MGSSSIVVTKISDNALDSWENFFDGQAITDCRFLLNAYVTS